MNSANDRIQQLFAKYEAKIQSELDTSSNTAEFRDLLSEVHSLRQAWDNLGVTWSDDTDRHSEVSRYVKAWEQVQTKLAVKADAVNESNYWQTRPLHKETETLLLEIAVALRQAISKPLWRGFSKRQISQILFHTFKEILSLGIAAALLLSSHNNFETRVIALLILIYNAVLLETGTLANGLNGSQLLVREQLGRLARSLKLNAPVVDFDTSEKVGMTYLLVSISGIFGIIRNLAAVIALIATLF